MKTGTGEALLLTAIMGMAIFFCRACPFLFFREKDSGKGINPVGGTKGSGANGDEAGGTGEKGNIRFRSRREAFLGFVEKTVPPLAMTVLTFNALAGSILENIREAIPMLAAAAFTVIVHLWRRNPLISIFGGTAVYMVLTRALGG